MIKGVKVVVFDQDGTLYPANKVIYRILKKETKKSLSLNLKINNRRTNILYEKMRVKYPNPLSGFKFLGLSVSTYHKIFDQIDLKHNVKKDTDLIGILEKIILPKYVVTFASPKYSERLQKYLKINKHITKTYCFSNTNKNYSKGYFYKKIANIEKVKPSEICVVGDHFLNDLQPAIKQNCKVVLVNNKLRKKIHNNKKYTEISNIYDLKYLLKI